MERTITILCKNNGESIDIPLGSTLTEAYEALGLDMPHGAACAEVNNTVENMNYVLFSNSDIKFLDITTPSGMRTYTRSLFFVLSKAVADSFPNVQVRIDTPVSNGYYCRLLQEGDITDDEVKALEKRMREIIEADIPFRRIKAHTDDVVKRFRAQGHESKAKLIENGGSLYSYYYMLEDTMDYFYGALLPSTGCIWLFGIEKYHDGVLLRLPDPTAPDKLCPLIKQEKMFGVFQENHEIQRIIGLNTIGDMNMLISQGHVNEMINVSEALQEKKIAHIADEIASRKDVRVVLISGPSSSGKTTFSKRLSVQLLASGLKPYPISMDNYFVDRDKTPRTPSGDYDFESLHALNTELLASQLNTLIAGGEVELPKYNFQTGKSEKSGVRLRTDGNTIIVMEGIHGLNPELTAQVPHDRQPSPEAHRARLQVSRLFGPRHDSPLAEREGRREEMDLPLPRECGRNVQQRAHLRARGAQTPRHAAAARRRRAL